MKIKVLRAFCIKGEAQAVGSTVEVADAFAREQIHIGRAEPADGKRPPAKAGPMTTQTAGALTGAPVKE